MRIFTGSYENCKVGNLVSISKDKGKSADFVGNTYLKLAPEREFFRAWRENIGKISEDENNKFYMEQFYKKILSKLNPQEVFNELEQFGNNVVLLCYENNQEFCHRQLVATWLEKNLKIEIPEIAIDSNANITILERNQKYVNDFNKIMNDIDLEKEDVER